MKQQKVKRSEHTKEKIIKVAAQLFSQKGFQYVTVREIAKEANCSHTTIYLYFKDKEHLLRSIVVPPLLTLEVLLMKVIDDDTLSPKNKLENVTKYFVSFSLENRTMYEVYFRTMTSRVDEPTSESEVISIRNRLFGYIQEAFRLNFPENSESSILSYSRIFYFSLNGMIHAYSQNQEPTSQLLERINPLIEEMITIILLGISEKGGD